MKKVFIALTVAIFAIAIIWYKKTSQYKPLENTIIVGTSADFPPFSFRDKNDEIVGFDIDIIKEISKRIGMEVDLNDRPFSMLLPQIQIGQIHIIAAGMTPTEERKKNVNFTKPYLSGNPLLIISLAKNPPISSLEDLKGKDIIVNTGYTADIYMSKLPGINIIRLSKVADAFAALEQGKGYAFVTASFTVNPYLKSYEQYKDKFNIFKIKETDESIALGVSKKLPDEFFEKIQKTLDQMEADGTLYALKQKWQVI